MTDKLAETTVGRVLISIVAVVVLALVVGQWVPDQFRSLSSIPIENDHPYKGDQGEFVLDQSLVTNDASYAMHTAQLCPERTVAVLSGWKGPSADFRQMIRAVMSNSVLSETKHELPFLTTQFPGGIATAPVASATAVAWVTTAVMRPLSIGPTQGDSFTIVS